MRCVLWSKKILGLCNTMVMFLPKVAQIVFSILIRKKIALFAASPSGLNDPRLTVNPEWTYFRMRIKNVCGMLIAFYRPWTPFRLWALNSRLRASNEPLKKPHIEVLKTRMLATHDLWVFVGSNPGSCKVQPATNRTIEKLAFRGSTSASR